MSREEEYKIVMDTMVKDMKIQRIVFYCTNRFLFIFLCVYCLLLMVK